MLTVVLVFLLAAIVAAIASAIRPNVPLWISVILLA